MLLVFMAFDRYAAVCRPLHYTVTMHPSLCALMASASWITGFANSLLQTVYIFLLPLCGRNKLDHFLCEIPPFLKLGSVDTTMNVYVTFFGSVIVLLTPVALIMFSYGRIVRMVLRIKSTAGRRKGFGTCGSHVTVVSLLFGTGIYVYLHPSSSISQNQDKFTSLFYTVTIPITNPFIYTLRNRDVKGGWRRCFGRTLTPDDGWEGQFNGRNWTSELFKCMCVSPMSHLKFPRITLREFLYFSVVHRCSVMSNSSTPWAVGH